MSVQPENPEPQNPPARQGFSPVLVILTIAVVGFVLWFCPRAILWAYRPAATSATTASPETPVFINLNR